MSGATRSPHTIRAYAGRVALFLGWCQAQGVEWRRIGLPDLARFKRWLEISPGRGDRIRSGSTVNADLLRMLGRDGNPQPPRAAFAEYGRAAKTLHLLAMCDPDDETYRQHRARATHRPGIPPPTGPQDLYSNGPFGAAAGRASRSSGPIHTETVCAAAVVTGRFQLSRDDR